MNSPAAAVEHLKVIRSMMERATVYRAISAPAAIFGGLLACATGGYFILKVRNGGSVSGGEFFWVWVGVMVLVDLFNTALLWHKASRAGDSLFSPAMRHACFAIAPPLLVGGALSYEAMIRYHGEFELGVLIWVFCYGLALLAMGPVAPRSLRRLGWVFIGAGLFVFFLWREFGAAVRPVGSLSEVEAASWIMIGTFGLLHLLHGGGVLMRKAKGDGDGELD